MAPFVWFVWFVDESSSVRFPCFPWLPFFLFQKQSFTQSALYPAIRKLILTLEAAPPHQT